VKFLGDTMRYEYKVVFGSGYSGMNEYELNELGKVGWELVAINMGRDHDEPQTFFFKRVWVAR